MKFILLLIALAINYGCFSQKKSSKKGDTYNANIKNVKKANISKSNVKVEKADVVNIDTVIVFIGRPDKIKYLATQEKQIDSIRYETTLVFGDKDVHLFTDINIKLNFSNPIDTAYTIGGPTTSFMESPFLSPDKKSFTYSVQEMKTNLDYFGILVISKGKLVITGSY